jgi:hypothetical protein
MIDPKSCSEIKNRLELIARGEELVELLSSYIEECRGGGACGSGRKKDGRIANVAGFCRYIGVGVDDFDTLAKTDPETYSTLCAVFEDEAFNSAMSPSILSVYLKLRLGYDGETRGGSVADTGQLRLVFDHDAYADGE